MKVKCSSERTGDLPVALLRMRPLRTTRLVIYVQIEEMGNYQSNVRLLFFLVNDICSRDEKDKYYYIDT